MNSKYIFFDWGYTLIGNFRDVNTEIAEILAKYSLRWEDVFKTWKNYQILLSMGRVTEKEVYRDLSLILKVSREDLAKIDKLLLDSYILDGATKATIVELFDRGYYLGIISNNSVRNVEYILQKEDLQKYFKKVVISEATGVRKPHLGIYLQAFGDISRQDYPKITLVSDELAEDLAVPQMLGVKTVWYHRKINNPWKKDEAKIIEPDYEIESFSEILNLV